MSALGIRVKSGWASAVLVDVRDGAPIYLSRSKLLLSDPDVPKSSQPYHRGFGSLQKNAAVIRRLTRIAHTAARRSLTTALKEYATLGHSPQAVALVVGSTIDPLTVANEHIRAHASEARLFRTSLERAAASAGVASVVYRERDLRAIASQTVGPSTFSAIATMGRIAGRPWRSDEKLAALAAWLVCTRPSTATPASLRAEETPL